MNQPDSTPAIYTGQPEREYASAVPRETLKLLGQFFTPFPVAEFMCRWIMGNPRCGTVLDPAVGLGVFFRAIGKMQHGNIPQCTGFDIDQHILEVSRSLFASESLRKPLLERRDYLSDPWDVTYDGIVCNPPYHRFQNFPGRKPVLSEFSRRLGHRFSGFTSLHALFLVKLVSQLSPGGRAAVIMPSEFLNADYGVAVKSFLKKQGSLRYVLVFDHAANIFAGATTTACILLFANDGQAGEVEFLEIQAESQLTRLENALTRYPSAQTVGKRVPSAVLDEHVKWHTYYKQPGRQIFRHLVPLSTFGKVMRGIATGDNSYFMFSDDKRKRLGITRRSFVPCIVKANHAPRPFFTRADVDDLLARDKPVLLLNAAHPDDPAVQRYIRSGVSNGVHKRYLTAHRNPWFAIEHRPPAPIWIGVFTRSGLRFIRNEAQIRHLTCFHSLYLHDNFAGTIDILMAYFLTDVAREIIANNRREYGDGLQKFEPNDFNRSEVADLRLIPPAVERQIRQLYRRYRAGIIRRRDDTAALSSLNDLFTSFLLDDSF